MSKKRSTTSEQDGPNQASETTNLDDAIRKLQRATEKLNRVHGLCGNLKLEIDRASGLIDSSVRSIDLATTETREIAPSSALQIVQDLKKLRKVARMAFLPVRRASAELPRARRQAASCLDKLRTGQTETEKRRGFLPALKDDSAYQSFRRIYRLEDSSDTRDGYLLLKKPLAEILEQLKGDTELYCDMTYAVCANLISAGLPDLASACLLSTKELGQKRFSNSEILEIRRVASEASGLVLVL
jgi:hypothetical protein